MSNSLPSNPSIDLGVVFPAIISDVFLFGVLSQQFYSYWIAGFKDSKCIKAFVIAQYCVVSLQCLMFCHLAWIIFATSNYLARAYMWQGPVSSLCQCTLSLMANIFLANRIYTLTKSRLRSRLIIALSITAFTFGLCALVIPWTYKDTSFAYTHFNSAAENVTTNIWHVSQAITEFLISMFLIRVLVDSHSGSEKSDSLVYFLTRRVIQLGFFATIWSLEGMVTWFLLPKYTIYTIFHVTAGPIYTHMIFDTLLSRTRLRERTTEGCEPEIRFYSQTQICPTKSEAEGQQGRIRYSHGKVSVMTMPNQAFSAVTMSDSVLTE